MAEGDDEPQIDFRAEAARRFDAEVKAIERLEGLLDFPADEFNKDPFEQKIRALKRDRYLNISANCEPICFNGDSVAKFNVIARKVNVLLGKDNDLSLNLSDLEPLLDELAERRKTEALEVAWSKLQNIMPDLRHRPVPSEAFIPLICHEVEKALRECRATQGELPPFAQELVNEAADFFGFNPGTQGLDSDPGSLGTVIHDPNGGRG